MKFNNDNQDIYDYLVNEVERSNKNIECATLTTENNNLYLEIACSLKQRRHTLKINISDYTKYLRSNRYNVEAIVSDIIDEVNNKIESLEYSDIDLDIEDFEQVRDKIAFTIASIKDEALLKEVPHLVQLDMAIYFYVAVDIAEDNLVYITIDNNVLRKWNVPLELIIAAAVFNTDKLLPVDILQLSSEEDEYDSEFFLYGVEPVVQRDVFILTNKSATQGACVILYPHVLENLADEVNDDLIIVPVTVHEVLVVKSSYTSDRNFLAKVIDTLFEFNIDILDSEALKLRPYIFERATNKLKFLERR